MVSSSSFTLSQKNLSASYIVIRKLYYMCISYFLINRLYLHEVAVLGLQKILSEKHRVPIYPVTHPHPQFSLFLISYSNVVC